jgi:endonuclease G
MVRSEVAMINTYMFSNMCPQHGDFNSGIWKGLKNRVRKWAKKKGKIYVITGAVFDKDGDQQRDADADANRMVSENGNKRVAVPTHFYKIILHTRPNGFIESMAFLLPHDDDPPPTSDEILVNMLKSIDDIEKITGIDFLADLRSMDNGAAKEDAIEVFKATSLWPTK